MPQLTSRASVIFWGVVLAICLTIAICWSSIRAHMQAASILIYMQHKPVPFLIGAVAHHDFKTNEFRLAVPGGAAIGARDYIPQGVASPRGIVVLHGVHALGMNEPRLETFSAALAACGFRVLTPNLPSVQDYRVAPSAIEQTEAAVAWLAQQTGAPVGIIGLSFSGGIALLAAASPQTAPQVRFVLTVGAEDSMQRVAQYYITGAAKAPDGSTFNLPPHEYGPLVLEYLYMDEFVPSSDAAKLSDVLRAHLYENPVGEAALMRGLTPGQRAEAAQLLHPDSPEMRQKLSASVARHTQAMDAISPAGRIAGLRAPVYLLHGSQDVVVPPTEMAWLARDLPSGTLRGELASPALTHVSTEPQITLLDKWHLIHFIAHVLETASA